MPSNPEPTEVRTFKETAENLNVRENVQGSLTAAEKAAAKVLLYEEGSEWAENTERHIELAQVVVAAVRPIIAAEALRAEADTLERAVQSEEAMPTMFVVPAHLWLRDRAEIHDRAAALRSTEKGTNQ
jgi:hypothetical protein